MPSVRVTAEISRGKKVPAGTTLRDLSADEAKRLVRLGFAEYVDELFDDDGGDADAGGGDASDGPRDVGSMTNKQLIAALRADGVKVTGRESKSELLALAAETWKDGDGE